ncbi:tRNA lysidine(34) synthetase TilS [Maritalea mediterranea]|uniref:tRNA(Ile)-lysidine synthase n=1 Tax=Maritalea mediterranea TaxID=2909667 RepID=A0ABS9E9Z7_9HYPH|nr:tRNA lysidine(34) synthetase TilS [Maritalea mediterranea]MCF4099695.1 tRNA lysidine(34) synthetase TilS [Maritalea mediterranea]
MLDNERSHHDLIEPEFLNYIFAPLFETQKAALAVSGGPDSMALMHLAARFAQMQTDPIALTVLSVDHGLRREAADEAAMVKAAAKALGLTCYVLKPENFHPETRIQESARNVRYHLMRQKMQALEITQLLTAHHLDDQAETFFMRLARGSGLSGLGGMGRTSVGFDLDIVRPLIDVPKADLTAYVQAENIVHVQDPSNQDDRFERVRWRQALKGLQRMGLQAKNIGLSARRLRRADAALDTISEAVYSERVFIDPFGCVVLDHALLTKEPAEIGIRLLARALDDAGGDAASPELAKIEALYDLLCMGKLQMRGQTLGGCGVRGHGDLVQVFREVGRLDDQAHVVAPGDSLDWDCRFRILVASDAPGPVQVQPAASITRAQFDQLMPDMNFVPMDAVRAAPLVSSGDQILALGEHVLGPNIDVFRIFGPNALS